MGSFSFTLYFLYFFRNLVLALPDVSCVPIAQDIVVMLFSFPLILILVILLVDMCIFTEIRWTKLYQKPSSGNKSKVINRQLMVRPYFPPVYRECQKPDINTISEVVVIVRDEWKVGDLVDWWADNCYWSATITKILGDGKARVIIIFFFWLHLNKSRCLLSLMRWFIDNIVPVIFSSKRF